MSAGWVVVAVLVLVVLVVLFMWRLSVTLGGRTTPAYVRPVAVDPDLEAARLHDRFVEAMTVAVNALACYEGECAWSVENADDEFDREAFGREQRAAKAARLTVEKVRDRRPGAVAA